MRKICVSITLVFTIGLCACKNNTSVEEQHEQQEVVYNDKIQDTFFGVSFGASKEDVITAFASHNFYPGYFDTDSRISFEKKIGYETGQRFSFGDMTWELIDVYLSNNRFNEIRFMNAHNTRESALKDFNYILSEVSAKYHLQESSHNDTTIYKKYIGKTRNGQWISILCFSYESVYGKHLIGTRLAYGNNQFEYISDEL